MASGDGSESDGVAIPTRLQIVARPGIFILRSDKELRKGVFFRNLAVALRSDPKVLSVDVPQIEDGWSYSEGYFPAVRTGTPNELFDGSDGFIGYQFSDPIAFRVRVPAKNQRVIFEGEEIPEDYYVLWDGTFVLVTWHQNDMDWIPASGGHVVREILQDATHSLGEHLYVQACSPGCDYDFLHTTMRLSDSEDPLAAFRIESLDEAHPNILDVEAYGGGDSEELAKDVFLKTSGAFHDFALLKNLGRRIIDLDTAVGSELSHTLELYRHRCEISTSPLRQWPKQRYDMRGWRRDAVRHIARIWSLLATIDLVRGRWIEESWGFESRRHEEGIGQIFNIDFREDTKRIEAINLDVIQQSMSHVSGRLDNRMLVGATLGGALAGGVVGAIVTVFH